jgi:hypothetical protein
LAGAYRGHPFIAVPQIIPEESTRRVLMQELAEGLTWDAALDADQRLRDAWGEAIYRFAFGAFSGSARSTPTRTRATTCSGTTGRWFSWTSGA